MSLRKKINEQFNTALKNKNKSLISTFRLILAAIKERDIANRSEGKKEEVKDPEIIKVLRKMKKQRQDSAELYKKGERKELLEVEESEIKILFLSFKAILNCSFIFFRNDMNIKYQFTALNKFLQKKKILSLLDKIFFNSCTKSCFIVKALNS